MKNFKKIFILIGLLVSLSMANNKLLIIVSTPLYEMPEVKAVIDQYQIDISNSTLQNPLFNSEVLLVNTQLDNNSNSLDQCTPEILKDVIKTKYREEGISGIFIVGSYPYMPVLMWDEHIKKGQSDEIPAIGNIKKGCPTDLYIADTSNAWNNSNGDEWYETFDSKIGDNGDWWPDFSKVLVPGIENGSEWFNETDPEMFYGRLAAGPFTTHDEFSAEYLNAEAQKIISYFNRVHQYRINKSAGNLYDYLSESEAKSALSIYDDDWGRGSVKIRTQNDMKESYQYLYNYSDYALTSGDVLENEMSSGKYGYLYTWVHSAGVDNLGFAPSSFNVERLESIQNQNIQFMMLASCGATRFENKNIGTAFVTNLNSKMYNMIGVTGSYGPEMNEQFFIDLNNGVIIGEAFKNYIIASKNEGVYVRPYFTLVGDPLITYSKSILNKAPTFTSDFIAFYTKYGVEFRKSITTSDPENDIVTLSLVGNSYNASIENNNFIWTPGESDADTTRIFTIKVTDVNGNYNQEKFTVTVGPNRPNIVTEGYLSDFNETDESINDEFPLEYDMSVGEAPYRDGSQISIRGNKFDKGLGVHSNSAIVYDLSADCKTFSTYYGIDDEALSGEVRFKIKVDNTIVMDEVKNGSDEPGFIEVDLTNATKLTLIVDSEGPKTCDHADWANPYVSTEIITIPVWQSGDWMNYVIGSQVMNGGKIYECISLSHTWCEPSGYYGYISWQEVN